MLCVEMWKEAVMPVTLFSMWEPWNPSVDKAVFQCNIWTHDLYTECSIATFRFKLRVKFMYQRTHVITFNIIFAWNIGLFLFDPTITVIVRKERVYNLLLKKCTSNTETLQCGSCVWIKVLLCCPAVTYGVYYIAPVISDWRLHNGKIRMLIM